ncbi:MAG: ATP synthase subunit I [Pigmentiphaga sp.]|nr:ATP synthase subunit I [Pigmentiphaga sp.]
MQNPSHGFKVWKLESYCLSNSSVEWQRFFGKNEKRASNVILQSRGSSVIGHRLLKWCFHRSVFHGLDTDKAWSRGFKGDWMADQQQGGSGFPQPEKRLSAQAAGEWDSWDDWEEESAASETPSEPIHFSEIERAQHNKQAMIGLMRTVVIQIVASFAASMLAWFVAGVESAVSMLLGSMAYTLPNAGFAFKLSLDIVRFGGGAPTTFFFGELLKMTVAALLLIVIASLLGAYLVWPAFLIGLIVALKSQWLTLAWGARNF